MIFWLHWPMGGAMVEAVTVAEARERWCPFRKGIVLHETRCLGHGCMLFVWAGEKRMETEVAEPELVTVWRCGLGR